MKIIFAVDGSEYSVKAAKFLAEHFDWFRSAPELRLLFVKLPIPSGLAIRQAERILGGDVVDRYYKEESEVALSHAEKILRQKNIPFQSTYKVGDISKEICQYAATNKADLIVMGSHGHSNIATLVLGSITTKVLTLTKDIPVLIVR